LAAKIEKSLGTVPELIPKGGGIFDVAVENELVYSKSQTGSFPDEERLVDELVSTFGGR
jgi:selenoprotein W-related protein